MINLKQLLGLEPEASPAVVFQGGYDNYGRDAPPLRYHHGDGPVIPDDIEILGSQMVFAQGSNGVNDQLRYLMYKMVLRDPFTEKGDDHIYWKAVRLLRVLRFPWQIKESRKLLDIQDEIMSSVWRNGVGYIHLLANILKPEPVGLLYCCGTQALGYTPEEAQRQADLDYALLSGVLTGAYPQLEYSPLNRTEAHWLRQKMGAMNNVVLLRGIPKARKGDTGYSNESGATNEDNTPDAEEQVEEFVRGMSGREYVMLMLASPLDQESITRWLEVLGEELSAWKSKTQGVKSMTAGISMPIVLNSNAGTSLGHSDSVAQGHNVGASEGVAQSVSHSQSVGHSNGVTAGENVGSNYGLSASHSLSQGEGHTVGQTVGQTQSQGESFTRSHSETASQGQGITQSESVTQGQSVGTTDTASQNVGFSHTNTANHTVGQGSSQSESSTVGESYGNSNSFGGSQGSSNSLSHSNSATSNESNSAGATSGQGESYGANVGFSGGLPAGVLSARGGVSAGNSFSQGTNETNSVGQSVGQTNGESQSNSLTQNFSQSASQQHSNGLSNSAGQTHNESYSTGVSDGVSQGYGTSQGISHTQSQSEAQGESHSATAGESVSDGNTVGQTYGSSLSHTYSDSQSVNASVGQSQSQNVGQSQGLSRGESSTDSVSNTAGQSLTQSQGRNVGDSITASQGATGGSSQGSAAAMSLGPFISATKSFQWSDENAKIVSDILEQQRKRVYNAIKGGGAMAADMYIMVEDEESEAAARGLSRAAWFGEVLPTPLEVLSLTPDEKAHLLLHAQAFSTCVSRERRPGVMDDYKYSTILLSNEISAYTHPIRLEAGGPASNIENMPVLHVPVNREGEIYLGKILSGERWLPDIGFKTPFSWRFHHNEMNHTLIGGGTRVGKTEGAIRFVAEARRNVDFGCGSDGKPRYYTIVALDWKDDWRKLKYVVPAEDFSFFSLGNRNFCPIRMNLLRVPEGVFPDRWRDVLIETFCLGFSLGGRAKSILWQALTEIYNDHNVFDRPERSTEIGLDDVHTWIYKRKLDMDSPKPKMGKVGNDVRDAYQRVLDRTIYFETGRLKELFCYKGPDPLTIEELCGANKVTVLEGAGLDAEQKKFVIGLISAGVYETIKQRGKHDPGLLLILEEAHQVLHGAGESAGGGSGGNTGSPMAIGETVYEIMYNEGAGLGLFVVALSQAPNRLPEPVMTNSSIVLAYRMDVEKDVNTIVKKIGRDYRYDDRPIAKWLPRQPIGTCIVRSGRVYDFKQAEPSLVATERMDVPKPTDEELMFDYRTSNRWRTVSDSVFSSLTQKGEPR